MDIPRTIDVQLIFDISKATFSGLEITKNNMIVMIVAVIYVKINVTNGSTSLGVDLVQILYIVFAKTTKTNGKI